MIRQTSRDVYEKIKRSGMLGAMQFCVYDAVYHYGPCTSAEAFEKLRARQPAWNPLSQSRARFTELREKGVLEEAGERTCRVTGRKAIEWRVTDGLPVRRTATRHKPKAWVEGYNKAVFDALDTARRYWLVPDDRFLCLLNQLKR